MSEISDRMKEVLGRMDDKTKNHIKFGDEVEDRRLETPSLGLTRALYGGWIMGRQSLIWGPKAAGKSTLMLQQIAIAQRQGLVCALIDVENAYDRNWAQKNGVDTGSLIVSNAGTFNSFVNDGVDMIKAGVDFIGVDSISFLMPGTYIEKDGELKPFENTGAIGGLSRSIGPALAQLNYIAHSNDSDVLLLMISQQRMAQKGTMHWGAQYTGGSAMDHAISQEVNLFASEAKDALIVGESVVDDRIVEKPIGRPVTWTVKKSRGGPSLGATGEYDLYFDGDHIGIDMYKELVGLAVEVGVIKKAGAWYSYNGSNIGQGERNVAKRLREDAELYESIRDEVM